LSLDYNVSTALLGLTEADTRRKGEQCGTVRRKGKFWYIRFRQFQPDSDGNLAYEQVERRIEGDFANNERGRRQAEAAGYDQWVCPANGATKTPQGLATVKQFYEVRFQVDHVDRLKESGRIFYRSIWTNHIEPSFGHVQMNDVNPSMVQALISAKLHAGLSTQTLLHVRNCLSAIFRHARGLRFYEGPLPTEGVKLPEVVHKARHALTWEQVKLLADAMPRYRNLVLFLSQTGLRIGEACALRWRYINLTDDWKVVDGEALPPNSFLVCSNWVRSTRTTTKNGSWRKIPLTAEAWVAVMLQYERSAFKGEDQPVFVSQVGTPINQNNWNNRAFKTAAKKVGLPWATPHCLRHTTATLADKAGLSIADKMKILGHSTAEMSTHYTHPEIERVRQMMEQMTTTEKPFLVKKGA
jgi:integrase